MKTKYFVTDERLLAYPCILVTLIWIFWFFFLTAQADYNTRRAGITSAIVIAILIPVGICLFCVLVHLRQKASEKAFNKGGTYGDNRNGAPFQPRETTQGNLLEGIHNKTVRI